MGLTIMDATTGQKQLITHNDHDNAALVDALVLYSTYDEAWIHDLESNNTIKVMDYDRDPATFQAGPYYAFENGFFVRKALNYDPGSFVSLESLPMSVPNC